MSDSSPSRVEKKHRRRLQILAAALKLLRREGAAVSTASIAAEARCSKETIYAWFGDRDGLFAELVVEQSAATNAALVKAVGDDSDGFDAALERFGTALLDLLTGEASVAVHRAAMAAANAEGSALGDLLRVNSRDTVGKLVVGILEGARADGHLAFEDAQEAFGTFIGLVMRDTQTLCLIGGHARPEGSEMKALARTAVKRFKLIYGA